MKNEPPALDLRNLFTPPPPQPKKRKRPRPAALLLAALVLIFLSLAAYVIKAEDAAFVRIYSK